MRPIAFAVMLGAFALAGGGAMPQTPAGPQVAPLAPAAPDSSAPPAVAPPPVAKACDAPDLSYLVGKSRTEIPVPVNPDSRRVYCTTCPVTQDYRPDRTNIVFDPQTGVIVSVSCG